MVGFGLYDISAKLQQKKNHSQNKFSHSGISLLYTAQQRNKVAGRAYKSTLRSFSKSFRQLSVSRLRIQL